MPSPQVPELTSWCLGYDLDCPLAHADACHNARDLAKPKSGPNRYDLVESRRLSRNRRQGPPRHRQDKRSRHQASHQNRPGGQ